MNYSTISSIGSKCSPSAWVDDVYEGQVQHAEARDQRPIAEKERKEEKSGVAWSRTSGTGSDGQRTSLVK